MSQLPPSSFPPNGPPQGQPPYQQPQYAYPYPQQHYPPAQVNPLDVLLAPAKRAAILMWIMSGLWLLGGGCCVLMGAAFGMKEVASAPEIQKALAESGGTQQMLQVMAVVMGVMALVLAVAMAVIAFGVRKGARGSLVLALVVTLIPAMLCLLMMLGAVSQGGIGGAVMMFVPLVLLVIIVSQLGQAMTRAERVKQWQDYLAGMAWQQQYAGGHAPQGYGPPQQQGGYAPQAGYPQPGAYPPGYGAPIPPPPPPPPPSNPPSSGDANGPTP